MAKPYQPQQPAPQTQLSRPPLEAVAMARGEGGLSRAIRLRATEYEVLEESAPNLLIVTQDYLRNFMRRLMLGGKT